MSYYVYVLYREDWETPFYVGLSSSRKRLKQHVYAAKKRAKKTHKDSIILKTVHAVGEVPMVVATQGLTLDAANSCERGLIRFFGRRPDGPLANLTDGGDGIPGFKPTDETRKRLSEAGRNREFSAEHKKHISASKLGHVQTAQTRRKISETRKARGPSKATLDAAARRVGEKRPLSGIAIGNALRGKPKTPEHVEAVRAALKASPAWAAYNARRNSRKGEPTPPPVEV